ncbi:MAG: hypothetical protein VYB44_07205 [Bacteroidota bacterium]|nr:hypothetical protein [Bacteroidota bacterium]
MKRLLTLIIGEILHLANRDIPEKYKTQFYKIKNKLVDKYGVKVGQDIQHIKQQCWSCRDGVFHSDWKEPETCWSCGGTGIYREEWNRLDKYQVGRHFFHQPIERMFIYDPLFDGEAKPIIQGYIRHQKPKYRIGLEMAYWLLLIYGYKPKLRGFATSKPRTPLLLLVSIRWKIRMLKARIKKLSIMYSESGGNKIDHAYDLTDLPF